MSNQKFRSSQTYLVFSGLVEFADDTDDGAEDTTSAASLGTRGPLFSTGVRCWGPFSGVEFAGSSSMMGAISGDGLSRRERLIGKSFGA